MEPDLYNATEWERAQNIVSIDCSREAQQAIERIYDFDADPLDARVDVEEILSAAQDLCITTECEKYVLRQRGSGKDAEVAGRPAVGSRERIREIERHVIRQVQVMMTGSMD